MRSIKVNQARLTNYIRGIAGPDCSIGLHEIGKNITNHSRRETAEKMMLEGLTNNRSGSTYFTVTYYDKYGYDSHINSFSFYGSINDKRIVVIAIPEYFKMSNGSIIYGGIFKKRFHQEDEGHPECLTDYIFSSRIPPEFILGFFTYDTRDINQNYNKNINQIQNTFNGMHSNNKVERSTNDKYKDVIFYENPKYYNKLSQQEKDDFIKNNFKNQSFFDITNEQSIKDFYDLNNNLSLNDNKESYISKTIKQYEHSGLYKQGNKEG